MSSIISGGTVEFECDDSIIVAIQRQASRTAVLTHVEDTTRFNIIAAAWNQAIGVFESATNQDTLREFSILGYPNMESSSALTEADFFCGETEHFTSSVSDYSSFLVDDEGMAFDPTGITQRTTICQINEGNDWKVRFEMIRVDSAWLDPLVEDYVNYLWDPAQYGHPTQQGFSVLVAAFAQQISWLFKSYCGFNDHWEWVIEGDDPAITCSDGETLLQPAFDDGYREFEIMDTD